MSSERGYAALITINWATSDVMWTIFDETHFPDPLLSAQRLAASVEPDWPGYEQKIIGNQRAGSIQAARILGTTVERIESLR